MGLDTRESETLPIKRVEPHQPVGGAIVDAQGHEVPITEGMVQQACQALEKHLVAPASKK